MKRLCTLVLGSFALCLNAQTTMFGLGDTQVGTYQLDTTTVRGMGTKTATAWVIVTQAPGSEAAKAGAAHMLIMFLINCPAKTIQPMAWKAKSQSGAIIGEGVHGKEKARVPQLDSMDERIVTAVCNWKR
jgi:hypothetical protein